MKTSIVSIFFLLLLRANVWGLEVGFEKGDHFEIIPLVGYVSGYCFANEGHYRAFAWHCRTETTKAETYQKFLTQPSVDADWVQLVAHQENGREVWKKVAYDSQTGASRPVNLLISSILQKPLLGRGVNKIHYGLFKKSELVAEGEFTVTITTAEQVYCKPLTNFFVNNEECGFRAATCNSYFERLRYCQ